MRKLKHSQNFIKNRNLVDYLIAKTGINFNDLVLEIGTGTGVITERLCMVARKVISVEKDNKLFRIAEYRLSKFDNIKLVNKDFMDYSLPRYQYKCFSNIPFNYTSDIVKKLLFSKSPPVEAYLFMQRDSAHRFLGKRISTQISLLLSPIFKSKVIYRFKREDFQPSPSVEVVLVSFIKRLPPDVDNSKYKLYRDFITFSFNQCNKSVRKTLLYIFTYKQLDKLSSSLDLDMRDKPSRIGYKKWLGLLQFILDHPNQTKSHIFRDYYEYHKRRHKDQKAIHKTLIDLNHRL